MVVRGAPLNGVTGAYGLMVALQVDPSEPPWRQRSKDMSSFMGASNASLHGRSQEATVVGWLKFSGQRGSSVGLQVSVI